MCLKCWFGDFIIDSGFEFPWAHVYNVAPLSVHVGSRQSMLALAHGPHDITALSRVGFASFHSCTLCYC